MFRLDRIRFKKMIKQTSQNSLVFISLLGSLYLITSPVKASQSLLKLNMPDVRPNHVSPSLDKSWLKYAILFIVSC